MAASAMVAALLGDGPVLILCPSTLTMQWQVELSDKLGVPSAVWLSNKKVWADPKGHVIKTRERRISSMSIPHRNRLDRAPRSAHKRATTATRTQIRDFDSR